MAGNKSALVRVSLRSSQRGAPMPSDAHVQRACTRIGEEADLAGRPNKVHLDTVWYNVLSKKGGRNV